MAHDCVVGLVMGVSRLGMGFFLGICPLWPGFSTSYCTVLHVCVFALDALTVWCFYFLVVSFLFYLLKKSISQDVAKAIRRPCPRDLAMLGDFSLLPFFHSSRHIAHAWPGFGPTDSGRLTWKRAPLTGPKTRQGRERPKKRTDDLGKEKAMTLDWVRKEARGKGGLRDLCELLLLARKFSHVGQQTA
ncbi:hypothetical protein M431DRAFT_325061 [Trichoderma harzianum CBS 226.95]|uniref:Uncharacterized protein n=1 Tax=Trichoderma harzianum CBS 226.95 TaxID=983964 RepID=A0A2T3ZUP3_TRIHA|nr:hypothetical protein M431DRAFT_325061 [Trichoderma harzianum CBS 226.95]PTB48527.1 hypothetical protein M431DRAFT_325061 [Trichoderma harzianum CBS 226.95]